MSKLIALQIDTGTKKRIVGKIGIAPKNTSIPEIEGRICLYKEENYKDAVSHKLNCLGIDYDAWEKAKELGAKGIVWYFKDRRGLATVSKETIDKCRKVVLDSQEGLQIRIPLVACKMYNNKSSIPFGWTNDVVSVTTVTKSWDDGAKQQSLF